MSRVTTLEPQKEEDFFLQRKANGAFSLSTITRRTKIENYTHTNAHDSMQAQRASEVREAAEEAEAELVFLRGRLSEWEEEESRAAELKGTLETTRDALDDLRCGSIRWVLCVVFAFKIFFFIFIVSGGGGGEVGGEGGGKTESWHRGPQHGSKRQDESAGAELF